MSKTAEEYWKAFPKHKPAKDADIAEAMREYAELYAQQRVSELQKENGKLKEVIEFADEELSRLKTGKESQLLENFKELEKENDRLRLHIAHGDDKILRCAFCGDEYPSGTPSAHHELLTAHVKVCKKHPYREISNSFDDYLKSLCRSVGVSDDEINLPSEHGNDRLRWAALYELKRIKDFNELLEENEDRKQYYEDKLEMLIRIGQEKDRQISELEQSNKELVELMKEMVTESNFPGSNYTIPGHWRKNMIELLSRLTKEVVPDNKTV